MRGERRGVVVGPWVCLGTGCASGMGMCMADVTGRLVALSSGIKACVRVASESAEEVADATFLAERRRRILVIDLLARHCGQLYVRTSI
jgi:hypothetical protein